MVFDTLIALPICFALKVPEPYVETEIIPTVKAENRASSCVLSQLHSCTSILNGPCNASSGNDA